MKLIYSGDLKKVNETEWLIDNCETLNRVRSIILSRETHVSTIYTLKTKKKELNLLSYKYLKSLSTEELTVIRNASVSCPTIYQYNIDYLLNLNLQTVEELKRLNSELDILNIYYLWLGNYNNVASCLTALRDIVTSEYKLNRGNALDCLETFKKKLVTDANRVNKAYQAVAQDLYELSLIKSLKLCIYQEENLNYISLETQNNYKLYKSVVDNSINIDTLLSNYFIDYA